MEIIYFVETICPQFISYFFILFIADAQSNISHVTPAEFYKIIITIAYLITKIEIIIQQEILLIMFITNLSDIVDIVDDIEGML